MNSIEAYVQFERGLISDEGEVTIPSTAEFLVEFMSEFHGFVTRVYTVLPRPTRGASSRIVAGTNSPIWPVEKKTAKVVVFGLP